MSRSSAIVAVATYGISWAIAIRAMSLPCPNTFPGSGPTACVVIVRAAGRRGARALHAGVHVGLVVVTDEQHVVVALEHARQAGHPDVNRAAVAALAHHPNLASAFHLQRRRDARGHGRRVGEEGVHPRHLPRGLRIGRREHLQAPGRVRRDQLSAGRTHRSIKCVASAQGLATALAGAVALGE